MAFKRPAQRQQRSSRRQSSQQDDLPTVRLTGFFPTKHDTLWVGDISNEQMQKLNDLVEDYGEVTIFLRQKDDDTKMDFSCYARPSQQQEERQRPARSSKPAKRKTRSYEPEEVPEEEYEEEPGEGSEDY